MKVPFSIVLVLGTLWIDCALSKMQDTAPHLHRDYDHVRNISSRKRPHSLSGINRTASNEDFEDSDFNAYHDDVGASSNETKFVDTENGISFDHVDMVMARLMNISMRTSSSISEILALQAKEFIVNKSYKDGWEAAVVQFNETQREKIFNGTSKSSKVQTVPVAYHVALIAYTNDDPAIYSDFNKDTREICSGKDIDDYHWKSYFKLLQLAIETLGAEERWKDKWRHLYRGAGLSFKLKEGQILAFQHFASTSATLVQAEEFASEVTLFEFQGFYKGTAMAIWDHSYFPFEQEVIFSPLQVFKVDSIHVGKYYSRYVLVKHGQLPPCHGKDIAAHIVQRNTGSCGHGNLEIFIVFLLVSIVMFPVK